MTLRRTLDTSFLRECLNYNAETGEFTWLDRPLHHFSRPQDCKRFNTQFAGCAAGNLDVVHGYWTIRLKGKSWPAHRIAWAIFHDEWAEQIDHINGVKVDNRIENLRNATHQDNMKNLPIRKDNASGVSGVSWSRARGLWIAQIGSGKSRKYLGGFVTIDEAKNARRKAMSERGYHENHGRAT